MFVLKHRHAPLHRCVKRTDDTQDSALETDAEEYLSNDVT